MLAFVVFLPLYLLDAGIDVVCLWMALPLVCGRHLLSLRIPAGRSPNSQCHHGDPSSGESPSCGNSLQPGESWCYFSRTLETKKPAFLRVSRGFWSSMVSGCKPIGGPGRTRTCDIKFRKLAF